MKNSGGSTNRKLNDLWQFLDLEDARSWNQMEENAGHPPTQKFLRPAMYGIQRNAGDSLRSQNGLQMPTFANRYNGNIQDDGSRPRKLPRAQIRELDIDDSRNDLYAMPNKLRKIPTSKEKKLPAPAASKERKTSLLSDVNWPFSSHRTYNGNFKPPSSGDAGSPLPEHDYNLAVTKLFKRYEAGSILTSVSSESPPVVYHDKVRRQIDEEIDEDNDIFSRPRRSSASKDKLWNKSTNDKKFSGRCTCSRKRIWLGVLIAFVVIAAAVAIGVGVSVTQNRPNSGNKEQNDSTKSFANLTTLGIVVPVGVTSQRPNLTGSVAFPVSNASRVVTTSASVIVTRHPSSRLSTRHAHTTTIRKTVTSGSTKVTNSRSTSTGATWSQKQTTLGGGGGSTTASDRLLTRIIMTITSYRVTELSFVTSVNTSRNTVTISNSSSVTHTTTGRTPHSQTNSTSNDAEASTRPISTTITAAANGTNHVTDTSSSSVGRSVSVTTGSSVTTMTSTTRDSETDGNASVTVTSTLKTAS